MRVEISKLHKRLKSNIVYVTHDQVEAMILADKIVIMNKGKLNSLVVQKIFTIILEIFL